MNYNDIRKRWGTGKREAVWASIANAVGQPEVQIAHEVLQAPLGDLIKAYVEHLSIPWWRRGFDWQIVERKLRRPLNEINLRWHDA